MNPNNCLSFRMAETDRLEEEILKYLDVLCAVATQLSANSAVSRQLVTDTVIAALCAPELQRTDVRVKSWLLTKMRHLYVTRYSSERLLRKESKRGSWPVFRGRTPFEEDTAQLSSFFGSDSASEPSTRSAVQPEALRLTAYGTV